MVLGESRAMENGWRLRDQPRVERVNACGCSIVLSRAVFSLSLSDMHNHKRGPTGNEAHTRAQIIWER